MSTKPFHTDNPEESPLFPEPQPSLRTFRFHTLEVRTVEKDGQIWFVAADVARALGYRDALNMVRWLDEDEKGTHNLSIRSQSGTLQSREDEAAPHNVGIRSENGTLQTREVTIISESGLYHALLKSRKPEAKPFRRWVTGEVLPAIRRTGAYAHRSTAPSDAEQTHPQIDITAFRRSPVGVLGPLFDVPKDNLSFQGLPTATIAREFKAALRIARDLAGDAAKPRKGVAVPPEIEERVRVSAVNILLNNLGVDISLMTSGRPFLVDSYDSDFLSATNIGLRLRRTPPAAAVNLLLEAHGFQVPGRGNPAWLLTDRGRSYGVYRKFSRPDGTDAVVVFWRPSILPILHALSTGEAGSDFR